MRSLLLLALLLVLLLGAGAALLLTGRRSGPVAAPGPEPDAAASTARDPAALEGDGTRSDAAQRERLEDLPTGAAPSTGTAASGAGPIRVRCVDQEGRGLAGVGIGGRRKGGSAFQTADLGQGTTDGEGRLLFPALAQPPEWSIEALALWLTPPGGWMQASWEGPVPAAELVLVLQRGAVLFGRVQRGDGSPLPRHAQLRLEWSLGTGLTGSQSFPIEDGSYETPAVLGGEVRAAGLIRQDERYVSEDVHDLVLGPGERRQADFLFDVGCDCRLSFIDEVSGAPIALAQVRATSSQRVALSDASGAVRLLDVLGAGESCELRFKHDDYPPLRTQLTCPDPPYELELEISVPPGFELGGVVQDGAGLPLPGLEVRCDRTLASETGFGSSLGGDVEKHAKTDADGRFLLRGFAAGEGYRLSFAYEQVLAGEVIAFPGAEQRHLWTITEPVAAPGRLLDHEGRPVGGLEVWASAQWGLSEARATTEADGSFRLEGLFTGRWVARVPYGSSLESGRADRKLTTTWFEVAPGAAPFLDLRLPAPRSEAWQLVPFRVRAFDEQSGALLDAFDVLLMNGTDNTVSMGLGGAALGADGFRHSLPEGTYDLFLHIQGYERAVRSITLEPRAQPLEVEFRLRREE